MNEAITELLREADAGLNAGSGMVGFTDLRSLPAETRQHFDYAVVIGLFYTKETIQAHKNGNPMPYYDELGTLNRRLDRLAEDTARFLVGQGYKALARTRSTITYGDYFRSVLPHKTAATLAGLGWIGKCALLVTREAGSALRLTVVLTNAPVACGTPVTQSLCPPDCTACMDICPGHAPKGVLWHTELDRDEFFDARACHDAARAYAKKTLGKDETVCGLCISHCPFTCQAYL